MERHCSSDVSQCVGERVTVCRCIGQSTHPCTVQYDDDDPTYRHARLFDVEESPGARPRVGLIVDAAQMNGAHVSVDLSSRQISVPEHLLDGAEVRPSFKKVGCERVSERMC